jgi:hypothetical protein
VESDAGRKKLVQPRNVAVGQQDHDTRFRARGRRETGGARISFTTMASRND